jgi:hypothetical protein
MMSSCAVTVAVPQAGSALLLSRLSEARPHRTACTLGGRGNCLVLFRKLVEIFIGEFVMFLLSPHFPPNILPLKHSYILLRL